MKRVVSLPVLVIVHTLTCCGLVTETPGVQMPGAAAHSQLLTTIAVLKVTTAIVLTRGCHHLLDQTSKWMVICGLVLHAATGGFNEVTDD